MQKLTLRHGDCVDVLKGYADGSIGAVISDPPYDLTSTSKGGFMGKEWDGTGIAFSARLWDEVYRALRPGGVVKAFSGTRTFHRMAAAMQEAGFTDLRIESWNYGSGFPKSMNISKQIDKTAGAEREVVGPYQTPEGGQTLSTYNNWQSDSIGGGTQGRRVPTPATEAAQRWSGWGTALKPGFEPVVVGRKPE